MRGSPELLRSGSPATIHLLIYYSINTRLPLLCRNAVRAKTLRHVLTTRMIILLYTHTVCCRRSSSLAFALQPGVIPVTRTYRGLLLLLLLLLFYRTLTDPVRILPWSQERRSQTGKTVVDKTKTGRKQTQENEQESQPQQRTSSPGRDNKRGSTYYLWVKRLLGGGEVNYYKTTFTIYIASSVWCCIASTILYVWLLSVHTRGMAQKPGRVLRYYALPVQYISD